MDQHVAICALKELALELGRTPTREEYCSQVRGARTFVVNTAGGYTILLQAAGLETYNERRAPKKIDKSIFRKSIEQHLEEYEPAPYREPLPCPTFAVLSDIHWPFESERVIGKFLIYVEREQPEWVILNGDAWDMYSHTKFPRSHNVFTPREEERIAREKNDAFWKEVKRRAPNARCVQMLGNHDIRPMKRVLESYPEAEDWIAEKLKALFTFEGVDTIMDPRQELYLNEEVIVFHGYKTQLGAHRDYTLMNCVNGHTHKGGTVFRRIRGGSIFEANSGFAGDPEAKGLTYTAQKANNWTPGFVAYDRWGVRFIQA